MQLVLDFVENRFELAALIVFLSIGGTIVADSLGMEPIAGLIAGLGFAVALPLALIFGDRLVGTAESDEDPLETLRERYARGEITHEEFERRVDRLLETDEIDQSDLETAREVERTRE